MPPASRQASTVRRNGLGATARKRDPVCAEVSDCSAEATQAPAQLSPTVDRVVCAAPEEDEPIRDAGGSVERDL